MPKKEKQKIDARFLKEALEEHEKAEKSGILRMLISRSVRGIPVSQQKESQEN